MLEMMATHDREAQFVDIDDLRVGMYVYIDLGWMKHPFTLNSFKISAQDQIETLINLGVKRVRWSPERSDQAPTPAAPVVEETSVVGALPQGLVAAVAADVAALNEQRQHRRKILNAQRENLEHSERQLASAAKAFRHIAELARSQPEAAKAQATEVVGSIVGQLQDQEETAIRLLSENMGERASMHSINVSVISLLLGKALKLDSVTLSTVGIGALLHDIGKLDLPERLRWLDSQFNPSERKLYQEHVRHGVSIAEAMQLPAAVRSIIAQHHELSDGRGYPAQLVGDQIDQPARIVALVNHYDNLCNPANPIQAVTPHEALAHIYAQMKRQFDNAILMTFIRMMGVYPPGSVVELSDGRFGLVVSVNSTRPLKPSIVVFDPRVARAEALVEDLNNNPDIGIRRSLKPLQLPKSAFDYLSPRQRMCYFFERARTAEGSGPEL
jgi:putative nucleotidyltransferase with HDIG domain